MQQRRVMTARHDSMGMPHAAVLARCIGGPLVIPVACNLGTPVGDCFYASCMYARPRKLPL
eukprot:357757-Chlamydomonas_euryale.AAC.5